MDRFTRMSSLEGQYYLLAEKIRCNEISLIKIEYILKCIHNRRIGAIRKKLAIFFPKRDNSEGIYNNTLFLERFD